MTPGQFKKLPKWAQEEIETRDRKILNQQRQIQALNHKVPGWQGEAVIHAHPLGIGSDEVIISMGYAAKVHYTTDSGVFVASIRDGELEIYVDAFAPIGMKDLCIRAIASNVISISLRDKPVRKDAA
mgnify:CR=1 FL=1